MGYSHLSHWMVFFWHWISSEEPQAHQMCMNCICLGLLCCVEFCFKRRFPRMNLAQYSCQTNKASDVSLHKTKHDFLITLLSSIWHCILFYVAPCNPLSCRNGKTIVCINLESGNHFPHLLPLSGKSISFCYRTSVWLIWALSQPK